MKIGTRLLTIAILAILFFNLHAEIKFSGDARVRPRVDQMYDEDGKTSQDMYYLYWIRMWMKADLTDGWFVNAELSSDGPADWIGKMGADGNYDNLNYGTGVPTDTTFTKYNNLGWDRNNSNGVIRWSEAYFGRNGETAGFSMGLLPLNGLTNHELDLHYYPGTESDIAYLIYNRNSATGFRGYYKTANGKLCATLTVDDNLGKFDGNDATKDVNDQYSALVHYTAQVGEMTLQPTLIKTIAPEGRMSPLTAGVNFKAPKLSGVALSGGGYYTMQSEENAVVRPGSDVIGKYSGFMIHGKVVAKAGPGSIVSWVDYSSIDMDNADDKVNAYYLWLMYKYVVYKSEVGAFAVMPTFRRISNTFGNKEFARNKIEITMQLSFK
ncbi:MAG: hypothetical protein KAR38_13025, partial [Calditrichia bacterium]|nr:hypothetical protein [Calditrichia bacterium]